MNNEDRYEKALLEDKDPNERPVQKSQRDFHETPKSIDTSLGGGLDFPNSKNSEFSKVQKGEVITGNPYSIETPDETLEKERQVEASEKENLQMKKNWFQRLLDKFKKKKKR